MDPQIATSTQLFGVSTQLFQRSLEGATREELYQQPGDNSNPLIWVAGHLTVSRTGLWRMLGGKPKVPWRPLFERGSRPGDFEQYPELDEIVNLWKDAGGALTQRFGELNDSDLTLPAPRDIPIADKTYRGTIHFMIYHEAYHVGQMAYLRKWLGRGSLIG